MQPDQIFVIIVASLIAGCVTLGMFAHAWGESRKQKGADDAALRLEVIHARLARMEEAIDSVSLEMERVAEGQRFTARLLAERGSTEGQGAVARPVQQSDLRRITPH